MNKIFLTTLAWKGTELEFSFYVEAKDSKEAIDKCYNQMILDECCILDFEKCKAVVVSFVTPVRI
jgi:hypothetical protein